MADVLEEIFGGDTNRELAREVAEQVAALVGSKVLPNNAIEIGKPYTPFSVSFHNKQFQCFFYLSDASYCFVAKRRPKTPYAEDYYVSLKEPGSKGALIHSPELSARIGVRVYRQPIASDDVVEVALSGRLLAQVKKIKFDRVRRLEFSPTEVDFIASLDTPEVCVEQATVLRDLVTLANAEAYERNKDFLES